MKVKIVSITKYFREEHLIRVGQIYNVVRCDDNLGVGQNEKGFLIKTKKGTYITMYQHEIEEV